MGVITTTVSLGSPVFLHYILASGVQWGSMKTSHFAAFLAVLLMGYMLLAFAPPVLAGPSTPLLGDAFMPPTRPQIASFADEPAPNMYQPSAFLAGKVAVRVVFVESNGQYQPSTRDWNSEQISQINADIAEALHWWAARLPDARIKFDITSQVVPSGYEPILHGLSTESQWVGDTLQNLGITASNYFDQSYMADEALRQERKADWATHIFVVNSSGTGDGRFADGHFAYAYVNGPFMVVTSDVGPYGTSQMTPVVAHEFGHIFGALDQYAAAAVPCSQRGGYLAVPTSNSQYNDCGSKFICVMLEPLSAYTAGAVDESALGQLGYRDSNRNGIPDPIDTTPAVQLQLSKPGAGVRPTLSGQIYDQPYPTPTGDGATINTITKAEYRIDDGTWLPLPPADGAFNGVVEQINSTLPLYDGQHTIDVRATNRIGAISQMARFTVNVTGVGAAPNYQASAPAVTNTPAIAVDTAAPNGSQIQISENPYFAGAGWIPASSTVAWQIPDREGAHSVYVRFRDTQGLVSAPVLLSITLDVTPPEGRAMLLRRTDGTWLEIQAEDSATTIQSMQISLDSAPTGNWQPFEPSVAMTLQASSVYVWLRDEAGNVSAPLQAVPVTAVWIPMAAR